MKLIYEIKKERYKEILYKSLNNAIESSKELDRKNAYKSFTLISIPIFLMVIMLKCISTRFNLQSDDIAQIILCIVLFYIYFEILLKILPKMLKKLLRDKSENLFEQKLANIQEVTKIILEIDNSSIGYYKNDSSEEILYNTIDEISIIDDFIQIQYIKDSMIHIPIEVFEDKDEFNKCYEILKENKNNSTKIEFIIDDYDFSFIKTEDDIINYNKYLYTTEIGIIITKILKQYIINLTSIIMVFIWIVVMCIAGFKVSLVVILINLIIAIIYKKTNVVKKQVLKNQVKVFKQSKCEENKYIKVKEDKIEFLSNKYCNIIKYKIITNIIEQNNLILLLKNDILIEYIPCRIFSSENDKERFINLLKSKID